MLRTRGPKLRIVDMPGVIGEKGELTVNSAGTILSVHDGVTPGGNQLAGATASPTYTNVTLTGLLYESETDNITAHAGGGQASATALTTELNRVTTVATAGDSVKLPVSAPGLTIIVINHGANSMQVYGSGTDTIDDVATATGVSQMAGSNVIYSCTTAGTWYSNGIGTGYAGSFPTQSYVNGLTAHAGGGQASATPITACIARFTTVATAGDSSLLPASAPGMQITVNNAGAASMNVFGAGADAINGGTTGFAVASGKSASFSCAVAGQWHAVLSA